MFDRRRLLQFLAVSSGASLAAASTNSRSGPATPAPAPHPHDLPTGPTQQIAMLIYEGMTALDLVGPQLMLASLMNVRVHLVAKTAAPITCDTGFGIVPTTTFEDCPRDLEVMFVPGGTEGTVAAIDDAATIDFISDRGGRARWVTSVCTGALVLGAAGLLRGYRATTHWLARDLLSEVGATAVDQRVVRDRNRMTGAGVSAGLDLGLALAIELRGAEYARAVALNAEYAPAPPVNAGTPTAAGPAITKMLRDMYAPFISSARTSLARRR